MQRLSTNSYASTTVMLDDEDEDDADMEALRNYRPSLSSAITLRTPKEKMPEHKPLIIQVSSDMYAAHKAHSDLSTSACPIDTNNP